MGFLEIIFIVLIVIPFVFMVGFLVCLCYTHPQEVVEVEVRTTT